MNKSSLRAKCAQLASSCPALSHALSRSGAPPLQRRAQNFATLVQIICEQSVSLASAQAVFSRIKQGVDALTPKALEETPALKLRAAGLTGSKVRTIHELANAIRLGRLDLAALKHLPDHGVTGELTNIHGIGPWTAQVYLIFALQRADVWPAADVALQTSMQRLLSLTERPSAIGGQSIAARWQPYRSIAARVLWHDYLHGQRLPKSANN